MIIYCGTPKVCDAAHPFLIWAQDEPRPVAYWRVYVDGTPVTTWGRGMATPNPTSTSPNYYEAFLAWQTGVIQAVACDVDGWCSDLSNAVVCVTPTPTGTATPTVTSTATRTPTPSATPTKTKQKKPHIHGWKW